MKRKQTKLKKVKKPIKVMTKTRKKKQLLEIKLKFKKNLKKFLSLVNCTLKLKA